MILNLDTHTSHHFSFGTMDKKVSSLKIVKELAQVPSALLEKHRDELKELEELDLQIVNGSIAVSDKWTINDISDLIHLQHEDYKGSLFNYHKTDHTLVIFEKRLWKKWTPDELKDIEEERTRDPYLRIVIDSVIGERIDQLRNMTKICFLSVPYQGVHIPYGVRWTEQDDLIIIHSKDMQVFYALYSKPLKTWMNVNGNGIDLVKHATALCLQEVFARLNAKLENVFKRFNV